MTDDRTRKGDEASEKWASFGYGRIGRLVPRLCLWLILLLVSLAVGLVFFRGSYGTGTLGDGSRLEVYSLRHGPMIEVTDGGKMAELLRSILPKGGLRLGRLHLRAPILERHYGYAGNDILYIELDAIGLDDSLPKLATPSIYGDFRGVFVDQSGFVYPQVFHDTNRARTGDFGRFVCHSYPRTSDDLVFHVQQRELGEERWKTLTTLQLKNPAKVEALQWTHSEVTTVQTNGWTFSIGDVEVVTNGRGLDDPVVPMIKLPVSVARDERWPVSWNISRIRIEDQWGNTYMPRRRMGGHGLYIVTGGEAVPDPSSMWKVRVTFKRGAKIWQYESLTVRLPARVPSEEVHMLGGIPLTIMRETTEQIRIAAPRSGSDVTIQDIGFFADGGGRSNRQLHAFRPLALSTNGSRVEEVLTIPKNRADYVQLMFRIDNQPPVTFYVQPRLIEESAEF